MDEKAEEPAGAPEFLGGIAAGAAGAAGAAYAVGESTLKHLSGKDIEARLKAIAEKGASSAHQAAKDFMRRNPMPANPAEMGSWTEKVRKAVHSDPAIGNAMRTEAEQLAAAISYKDASLLEKPLLAFKAASIGGKFAILGAGATAALGAMYLINNYRNKISDERMDNGRNEKAI